MKRIAVSMLAGAEAGGADHVWSLEEIAELARQRRE